MERESLSSIKKAIVILELLSTPPYEYTVAVISKQTGINITTIYRIIAQLEEENLVAINAETKKYRIGSNAYHIGSSYIYRNNYMQSLEEIVHEISEKIKESVGIAIFDQGRIMSIIESEIHQPMKVNDIPGRYFPGNKGNYGKCIMAFQKPEYIEEYLNTHTFEKTFPAVLTTKEELLEEYAKIRERGYSESVDELAMEVVGVGVPLFDKNGQIWGCIAVGFFREAGWEQKMAEIRDVFFQYKRRLEQCLL